MSGHGHFSFHRSEKNDSVDLELFNAGDRKFVIGRRVRRGFDRSGNMGEFFMMARAKSLGREFAARQCAPDALEAIRSSPEDEPYFRFEDQAREWELLDQVDRALLTSFLDADALRSSMTFCKIMKISCSDAIFHGFNDRWRPALAPTEEMLLQAATEMEESFIEEYGDYHADDLESIRSAITLPQPR